jgi:DNA-binding NarL/FixJ family response regulator
MAGGTLLLSKSVNNHAYFKKRLEELGFRDVFVTALEKDGLNFLINELKPRIVLMSSSYYKSSTPYMMKMLLRRFPDLNIAVVSLSEYPADLAMSFINNGANSYVNFWDSADDFYLGLNRIKDGKPHIPICVQERINMRRVLPCPSLPLTEREIEVMRLMCNGFTNYEAAGELAIAERTVYRHKEDLYERLCLRNEKELIRVGLKFDVIKADELDFYGRNYELPGLVKKGKRTGNRQQ